MDVLVLVQRFLSGVDGLGRSGKVEFFRVRVFLPLKPPKLGENLYLNTLHT
jgi:hypothetical protein